MPRKWRGIPPKEREGKKLVLRRRQLLHAGGYPAAFSDSAGYLSQYSTCVDAPCTHVAGKFFARFQMGKTVVRCLKRSLPVLLYMIVLLAEGQTVQVPGTDLTITATSVRDLTSEGCLGGPMGCLDTVQLKIARDNLDQQITLSAAQTEIQRSQEINRTKVFGHEITLVSLKNKQVVLDIAN